MIRQNVLKDAAKELSHLNAGNALKILMKSMESKEKKIRKIPGFDSEKYQKLQEHPVSIVSEMCVGGALYRALGLRYESPFINVRIGLERNDYFEFLNHLDEYMSRTPSLQPGPIYKDCDFIGWETRTEFPILWYDNIMIHGFHYRSIEEMMDTWERRRKRFHSDNVVILKILYDDSDVDRFERLPFKKKLGFYYKPTPYDDILTLGTEIEKNGVHYSYWYAPLVYQIIDGGEVFQHIDIFKFLS